MMIFRQSNLRKALVISTLLHLLLFSVVKVVVKPSLKLTFYPQIAFLGPILSQESVSPLQLSLDKKELFKEKEQHLRISSSLSTSGIMESRKGRIKLRQLNLTLFRIKHLPFDKEFKPEPETIFPKSKQQPKYLVGRKVVFIRLRAKKQTKDMPNIFWNPPYQRDIIYKPPLPKSYLWTRGREGDFSLEFEFLVSPQGRITTAKLLTSSGYPEIDAQAIRYLKKWQFAPSPQEQRGRIRLNFKFQ